MSNVKDFINLLKTDLNDDVAVFVPSQQRYVSFKPLSVSQQKEIIKQSLGGVKGTILIAKVFNDIILYNRKENIPVYISDRNAILVQLRRAALGEKAMDLNGKIGTLADDFTGPDLKAHKGKIEYMDIVVEVDTPDLAKDSAYYDVVATKNFESAGDVVNEMYSAELAKFIKTISFQGNLVEPKGMKEKQAIIDVLPTALLTQVMQFIKNVKNFDSQYLVTSTGGQAVLNAGFFNDPL